MAKKKTDLRKAQLFLDDTWVEDSAFCTRTWHEVRKYPEPVLPMHDPYEYSCPVLYGTVLRLDGLYRMWYCAWSRENQPRVCYAESDDGVVWRRPELGLCEFGGSAKNNIVMQSSTKEGLIDDLTVIEDPGDRKYPLKALFWEGGFSSPGQRKKNGIWAAKSSDGLQTARPCTRLSPTCTESSTPPRPPRYPGGKRPRP